MIKRIMFCDKCGKEIKENPIITLKYQGDVVDGEPVSAVPIKEHYHAECLQAEKEQKPAKTTPVKIPVIKEQRIDTGKCLALRNAGWSTKDIAEEMHLNPGQVSNAIARERAKLKSESEEEIHEDQSGVL